MNLSIRHWLVENHIDINQIEGFSQEQITGIALLIIRDMQVRSFLPFDICTLAEVLELPLGVIYHEISVFTRLTRSFLDLLAQNKPFKRNEATWLAFQVAYLQALKEVLIEEESLSRVWLERALVAFTEREQGDDKTRRQGGIFNDFVNVSVKPLQDEHLQASIKILRGENLTQAQTEEALYQVADSYFVQKISSTAVAWLVANSVAKAEAELIIGRLQNKLLGHLIVVVSENAAILVQLQKFFKLGNAVEFKTNELTAESDYKIDLTREYYRASLIQNLGEPLLIESFSLKDVYVPLPGLLLQDTYQRVDLMNWVVSQLEDLETITVIESQSGYGKTSFCQIFAARVARKFYPEWIPIFIHLSEIKIGETFQETLQSAFVLNSQVNLFSWLENPNHKCLLILDGLNEIPNSTANKMAIAIFMRQLFDFQLQFRHKIILTSQSWALEDILSKAASKLRRIQIQPWEQDEWKHWFENWSKVQSMPIAQNFFTLLKKNKAFSRKNQFILSDIVRQPLMLYLLAVLQRDQLLDDEILQSATNPQNTNIAVVLWPIYQRVNQWLLGYPVPTISQRVLTSSVSTHIHRTLGAITSLTKNRYPQELIDEMQTVALQILRSGQKKIDLKGDFSQLSAFYFKSTQKWGKGNKCCSRSWELSSTPSPPSITSTVEFSHSKLGEYLCAASIVTQLKALTTRNRNTYGEIIFTIDSGNKVAEHLYYLLGYGILTQEIEELVIEGLKQEKKHKFSFELLCSRLQPFWYSYCSGRWLDEGIAHKAWSYFKELENPINVEQVNAAVGINVFLLLSACYRETKETFYPCGEPSSLTEFHPQAIIRLIAKTAVFQRDTTIRRIGEKSLTFLNLSKADLTQAMLDGVNFANTDLSHVQLKDACLVGANLADANLTDADLTGANLTNANLTNAKLTCANLTGANMQGVNLDLVNLSNACLFQAIISEPHKETAIANGAVFSLDKFEELKRLLSYKSQTYDNNTGDKTEIAFKETPSIGRIESAEGEPIFPLDLDDNLEDETFLETNPRDI